ncbi:type II toxin-antitoxin system VapC family toxin [Glycomyces sp. NPDC046736]|uniref:type II toxin-antitoxin system VapC family toxin n=1 Tax=Glycomyces sp. NPDC046736 TaxID=3155615 RepID=UPI00340827B8
MVDSNIWLDLFGDDQKWADWSEEALARSFEEGLICINPIIYAEVSVRFDAVEPLEALMPDRMVTRQDLPYEAAFLAGKAFAMYRKRGGTKRSPIPDFYIGAHAMVAGHRLLTRDTARYKTYFPRLEVIGPD